MADGLFSKATTGREFPHRPPRVHWGRLANLVDRRGRYLPVVVENVSTDGVMLQSDDSVSENATYTLICKHDRCRVEILWTQGRFSGGKIVSNEPVDH